MTDETSTSGLSLFSESIEKVYVQLPRRKLNKAARVLQTAKESYGTNGLRLQSTLTTSNSKRYAHAQPKRMPKPVEDLTTILSDQIADFSLTDLSDRAVYRSKRMILDSIGVGIIGSQTDIANTLRQFAVETNGSDSSCKSIVWGSSKLKMSSPAAAYLNGASTHTMDFDDTWHPATHPSGPVLPAILAIADALPVSCNPSLEDVLVAFNIGIQIQGALLRCSSTAKNIPNRLHPPAIVGVMGSAAASSRLLRLSPWKSRQALAIAASFAGAPMANAGTMTKPLHAAKSARFGLEAALLADKGIEGNNLILDTASGFGAYYDDYDPDKLINFMRDAENVLLHEQDIAIKRYPCHLGMHWGIDAAIYVREEIEKEYGMLPLNEIASVVITAPKSKYINRPIPQSEHEGRHSFQFTVCSALLDGKISPETFKRQLRERNSLVQLLDRTIVVTPDNNRPSFDKMYVNVSVQLNSGKVFEKLCLTPYGHWRFPLSDNDVQQKFLQNTKILKSERQSEIIKLVLRMDGNKPAKNLSGLLQL